MPCVRRVGRNLSFATALQIAGVLGLRLSFRPATQPQGA
jgi:hypothetical protein